MLTHITHIETHTGYKVICIYLETQAWARQSSLLNIPRNLFSFVEVDSAAGRMTVKTFKGTNELSLWKSKARVGEIKGRASSFYNYLTWISSDSVRCVTGRHTHHSTLMRRQLDNYPISWGNQPITDAAASNGAQENIHLGYAVTESVSIWDQHCQFPTEDVFLNHLREYLDLTQEAFFKRCQLFCVLHFDTVINLSWT